jgi:hypothetical protein
LSSGKLFHSSTDALNTPRWVFTKLLRLSCNQPVDKGALITRHNFKMPNSRNLPCVDIQKTSYVKLMNDWNI